MKTNILLIAALLCAMAWTGCRKIEETGGEKPAGAYTLIVDASKGFGTKALDLDDSGATDVLNACWQQGEVVKVFLDGTCIGTLTATPNAGDASKATLSGTLSGTEGVVKGAMLTLLFPRTEWDYTGQDGTLETIASSYDYAKATVTIDDISGTTLTTTTTAVFENQQSIYRFGFGNLKIKQLTFFDEFDKLVQSRTWNGSEWQDNYGPITITAPGNGTLPMVYTSLRNMRVGTSGSDYLTFTLISDNPYLYMGNMEVPYSVLDVQGKFISARNVSVGIVSIPRDFFTTTSVNYAL